MKILWMRRERVRERETEKERERGKAGCNPSVEVE
jgi:hypothetical protein